MPGDEADTNVPWHPHTGMDHVLSSHVLSSSAGRINENSGLRLATNDLKTSD